MHQAPEHPYSMLGVARVAAGTTLLGMSSMLTWAQGIDAQAIGSAVNVLALAFVGALFLLGQTWIRFLDRKSAADRKQRQAAFEMEQTQKKSTIALEVREKAIRERAALRSKREYDQAMKGTLTAKVEELTAQLEENKQQMQRMQDDAERERADLSAKADAAARAAHDAEARLSDLLLKGHAALSDRLDRGNERLDQIEAKIDRRRILVVEDDPAACRAMVRLLQAAGFESEGARSLAEARKKFTGRCYWVWIDLGLPDGSGLEFAREIKERGLTTKVGVMTGAADGDGVTEAADLAMVDLLRPKPINVDEIVEDMRRMEEEAPRTPPKPMKKARK